MAREDFIMRRIGRIVTAWLLLILAAPITWADGIAIVQAPEQSSGICVGKNARAAFACATKKCVAGGAAAEDCQEMTYCDYSWTVDVFLQGKEGNHWHEYHCGWRSLEDAKLAGALVCNKDRMKDLMECAAVQFYAPDGTPQLDE
jgi:hypothetical protein